MTQIAGVVAIQGDVSEHAAAIQRAAAELNRAIDVRPIRRDDEVSDCDFLAIPGGESTTISRFIHRTGMGPEIQSHVNDEKPVLATCAGLIVLSRDTKDERVPPLGCLDATITRNAFGRQRDSFETSLDIVGLESPFPAIFIRAPAIESVGSDVDILATINGRIVAIRDGSVLATAFHPELTNDPRIHRLAFFD